jgi:hypothetical protein
MCEVATYEDNSLFRFAVSSLCQRRNFRLIRQVVGRWIYKLPIRVPCVQKSYAFLQGVFVSMSWFLVSKRAWQGGSGRGGVGVGWECCRPGRRSASGSKVGSKMMVYIKMFDSVHSTVFKLLRKMTGNSRNAIIFTKFVIYVRGGRCDCSPRAPAISPTPLENG